jgi:dipeptidyl aminopeptidase/acylaminoacyl peptidase
VTARWVLLAAAGLVCLQGPSFAFAQSVTPVEPALAEIAATRWPMQAAVSPDGARLAFVNAAANGKSGIYVMSLAGGDPSPVTTGSAPCDEHAVAWSPDSRQIAFLSDREMEGQLQLYIAPATGGKARQVTHLTGLLAEPRWSPDGKSVAVLFTENLPRAAGPLDPVLPVSGVAESKIYEQRLAIVDAAGVSAESRAVRQISPADYYIYEYDWSPDGASFAVTASRGAGDDNWWIAQLFTLAADGGGWKSVYKPPVERQLAVPRWSPDGRTIVFIGGLMSDEGSTGGEIFQLPAAGGQARSLTPGMASSASYLIWASGVRQLYFTEHYDGGSAISKLDPATGQVERLWQGDESINPPFEDSGVSISDDGKTSAVVRSSWRQPPEIWAGRIGEWSQRTHANAGIKPLWGETRNLHWASDGFQVQGWLLYPVNFDAGRRYPLVVAVHGGPASSLKPSWPRPGFNPTLLSQQGYFVLMANPRGSYGQGEKFTMANVKDFGGGDLRDILAGVDEAVKTAPIDPQRIGLTGWSYGGFMTMWAVTQTTRFRAAVAGAGIANWKSYYGENAIDQWMIPYFGATVYDDPAVYARSSAIDFIKQAKTPTLVVVGAGDGECPPPQSFEFWHALKTLGVKTELVVYPDEGHRFSKPADQRDVLVRMIQWFNENLR